MKQEITSRYSCALKDLSWKQYSDGTISSEIVTALRIDDGTIKDYHISDLRAPQGTKQIIDLLNKQTQ